VLGGRRAARGGGGLRGVLGARDNLGKARVPREGAGVAQTSRRRTAHARALWRAGARATPRRLEIVSDWPCSSEIFSKNLNKS
jgi:hypothetical protein